MKFLIDAQLPATLTKVFIESGFDCIHTLELPYKNLTSDETIREISLKENRIVITKGTDFFHSFILNRKPYKLVFITVGNLRIKEIAQLLVLHFQDIVAAAKDNSIIELNKLRVKILAP